MDGEQWNRAKEIFGKALACDRDRRNDFLQAACGGDESMRLEVASLLSAYDSSDGMSIPPWLDVLPPGIPVEGRTIGPYRLVRRLGEGGMGQVWLAEQSVPVQRQVAIKLLRVGVHDPAMLRRFRAERQSLALMDHPAIAKVFDAGATSDGQPFLVMEYVPGQPVTDYCDQNRLRIHERLDLFVAICDGVQHAHQKTVIHRDLKPANLLVVEVDGKPAPRIIDFGLAKTVALQADEPQTLTGAGRRLGTPGYMSPEQADPRRCGVDTRTDVYSLGSVLYELAAGVLPFDVESGRPVDEVLRQLREEDPPRPSARIGPASVAIAANRGTDPGSLARVLRGNLDVIAMKALERDRERRYGSAAELADDIRRYRRDQPNRMRIRTAQRRSPARESLP
jgi:eukaryotic-like serine/threonine-protein kinase